MAYRAPLLALTLPALTLTALTLTAALLLPGCSDDTTPQDAAPGDGPGPDAGRADGAPDGPRTDALLDLSDAHGADQATTDAAPLDGPTQPDQAVLDAGTGTGPLRVATFNCHCLLDSPATRAKGIAAQIVKLNPDVVGLQEICQTTSSPTDNYAKTIAAELKTLTGKEWQTLFAKTHQAWTIYDEGIGLMAPKGTIVASGELGLPQGKGPFPRKVAWAKLATSRGAFYFYSTHLTISSDPNDRLAQVKAILVLVNQHLGANLPQVVVGDFNDWYGSSAVTQIKSGPPAFTESWGTMHPGSTNPGLTCCYPGFASRIDYVFVRSAALKSLDQVDLAFDQPHGGVQLSDHRGIFVAFTAK